MSALRSPDQLEDIHNPPILATQPVDLDTFIDRAREGDADAFATLFRWSAKRIYSIAGQFYAPGWSRDDLLQEATIGFYKAIRDYRPQKQASFGAFADLCVRRNIMTFIRASNRIKHRPLNHAVSLDAPLGQGSRWALIDVLPQNSHVGDSEADFALAQLLESCTALERSVLQYYSAGHSINDIALTAGCNIKAVTNALWRARVKARRLLSEATHT